MNAARGLRSISLPRRLVVEPRRPARVRNSSRAAWYVVAAVSVGAFMGQLDASIVTVALPSIGAHLHASVSATQWVSLSYLLTLVCLLVPIGRLADRAGRKLLYVYGFAVFTAGSALCAIAPTLGWLVGARVVQGAGAAMLQANSVALIREALPRRALTRGLGLQGAAQALGLASGPAIGGLLLALGTWRLLFLVNLPAGCAGIALGVLLLPRSARRRAAAPHGGSDRLGGLLLAACVGDVLLALSLALHASAAMLAALTVAALAAGIAFVRREARAPAPLLDLGLLRRPALSIGLSSGLISYAVMFGTLFVVPYYLVALHTSAAVIGAELAALPIALGIVAALAGRLGDTRRARAVPGAGMLIAAAGLLCVAAASAGPARIVGLIVVGAGIGAFTPANNAAIMGAAPDGRTGVVSGTLNLARALGTALGIALTSVLYAGATRASGVAGHVAPGAARDGLTLTLCVWAAVAAATGIGLLAARGALDRRPGVPAVARRECADRAA